MHVAQAGSPGNGSKREQTGSTPQGRARWGLPRSTPKAPTILDLHSPPPPAPAAFWEVLHETIFSELQVRTWHQTEGIFFFFL